MPDPAPVLKKIFDASPDQTFDRLFGRHRFQDNMTRGHGDAISYAHFDFRIGGEFEIQADLPDGPFLICGEFLKIQRPDNVVFTCTLSRNWDPTHRLSIVFLPYESICQIVLTMDAPHKDVERHWAEILDYLVKTAS